MLLQTEVGKQLLQEQTDSQTLGLSRGHSGPQVCAAAVCMASSLWASSFGPLSPGNRRSFMSDGFNKHQFKSCNKDFEGNAA